MEQDTIRARRIELVDDEGNPRVIIDGAGFTEGFVGIVARGEDGTTSTLTLGIGSPGPYGPGPYLRLSHGKAHVEVGFGADGNPIVSTRDIGGEEHPITPE